MSTNARNLQLPANVKSRRVNNGNGLDMHILEAGEESEGKPLILLLHGFPELSYSYRKIIKPLSKSGYHVVAPDQRGYGQTTGWDKDNLSSFRILNLVADIVGLTYALGYKQVDCIVGHDAASPVAAYSAMIRPDIFRAVVMMSTPFDGPPSFLPSSTEHTASPLTILKNNLAQLIPPRKHYKVYYAPPCFEANDDMLIAPQGLHQFLRAYFHVKSADWTINDPHPLASFTAAELAILPEYYIMQIDKTMAQTVAPHFPDKEAAWLTDAELSVYVDEYRRNTFQGGLNWYQLFASPQAELRVFAGRKIEIPALFVAGEKDWGMYQIPGALEKMQTETCVRMGPGSNGVKVVRGAGHWLQQEKPQDVVDIIISFLSLQNGS